MNYIIRFAIGLVALLFLSCTNSKNNATSQPKNDSIKKYLELASNDTIAFNQRDLYNKKAFSFLDLSKNDTLTRWYLFKISLNFDLTSNKEYNNVSKLHFEKSKFVKDTLNLARYYRYKAGYLKEKNVYDSSFYYYLKSEKMYLKTNDKFGLAKVYLNKGYIQYKMDDYLGAEISQYRALYYFKTRNKNNELYSTFELLGNISLDLRKFNEAIFFNKKALKLVLVKKIRPYHTESLVGTCLNNIGNCYREQKNYKLAITYFKLALKEKNLLKNEPYLYSNLCNNLGYCCLKIHDYSQLPLLFLNSAKVFDSIGVKNESAVSYIYLSNYYLIKKDTINATYFVDKSLSKAKEAKAPYYYLTALSNAGTINIQKAPLYLQEYHKLNDSLLFAERTARNQFYKIQFDVDQITEEKETAIKQKWVIATMMSGLLFILILLFVIFRQQAKQKETKLQQDEQKANEETYQMLLNQQALQDEAKTIEKKRIALELHDNILNKLAGIRFNLYSITHKNDPETIQKALVHLDRIKDVEDEIRTITHDFSNEMFAEGHSFRILLEKLIEEQNKLYPKTKYRLELEDGINWDTISSKIKMNLYRIIQEGLYNIHKHAQASKAVVAIIQDENNICMAISDNGLGFDKSKIKAGIGIKNIKLRVRQLSGKISINSCDKNGTAINMAVPIVTINT